jgi:hypothetical protein
LKILAQGSNDKDVLLQLNAKVEKINRVLNDLIAAVSVIPAIQDRISHISEAVVEVLSYTKSIVIASESSSLKGG